MEIKQYIYFNNPGEKEKVCDIAKRSLNETDMVGRLLNMFPETSMGDARIIANKFYKQK